MSRKQIWTETETNNCRTFRLGEESELLHIIKMGFKNKYLVVREYGYDYTQGQITVLTAEKVKLIFGIEL